MKELSLVIGCGYTSQRSLCKRDRVLAVDIDKEKIHHARETDHIAHYIICDARRLPLRSDHFEDVVCTDVLEHITGYEKLLFAIIELRPHFVHLRYPTETREKLLIGGSKVYREQFWGRIHLAIVQTRRIKDFLEKKGYRVDVELTSAISTINRLILQATLEKLGIRYNISDLGSISFSDNTRVYGFVNNRIVCRILASIFFLVSSVGYLTYFFWRYLGITSVHDNYVLCATLRTIDWH